MKPVLGKRRGCRLALLSAIGVSTLAFGGACSSTDSSADSARGPTGDEWDGETSYAGSANANIDNGSYPNGAGGQPAVVEPETEAAVVLDSPQAGTRYVYAANADRDTVAVIDAESLAIHTVETGDEPRCLRTLPDRDAALTVDVASSDVAYIQTEGGASRLSTLDVVAGLNAIAVAPDGEYAIVYFDAGRPFSEPPENYQDITVLSFTEKEPRAQRLTVGFRPRQIQFGQTPEGNPAAYLITDDGVSIVDFREVLGKSSVFASTVGVFEGVEQKTADVAVTADGRYAIGRMGETPELRLVELPGGAKQTLDLGQVMASPTFGAGGSGGEPGTSRAVTGVAGTAGAGEPVDWGTAGAAGAVQAAEGGSSGVAGAVQAAEGGSSGAAGAVQAAEGGSSGAAGAGQAAAGGGDGGLVSGVGGSFGGAAGPASITDVDLSPDGSFALAVVRDRGALVKIPVPGGFKDASRLEFTSVEGIVVGQAAISPNAHWVLLYTTVVPSQTQLAVVDLTGKASLRILDVKKAISGITFSIDGERAFIVHSKAEGDPNAAGIDDDEFIRRSYGYSVLDLATGFSKLEFADSDIASSVLVPGTPYAFLTFGGASREVHRVDMESLLVDSLELGSLPISLGAVARAERVFVSQEHTDGRITFIDWDTMDTSSVTGFELNSKIRE